MTAAPSTALTTALASPGSTMMLSLALRPASLEQAMALAERLSGNPTLPAEFQKPASILLIILKAADMGLSVAQAFAGLHVIKGRVTMASTLCVGLVRRDKSVCRYFRVVEDTGTKVTYETQREGDPSPVRASFEVDEAKKAGLWKDDSNWVKFTGDMLHARAAARLCRRVYQDLLLGMPPLREDVEDGAMDLQEDPPGQWSAPPMAKPQPVAQPVTKPVTMAQTPVTAQQPIEVAATPVPAAPVPAAPVPTSQQAHAQMVADQLVGSMLDRIEAAKSVRELEALVPDMQALPEAARAALRVPYRAAKEVFLRMAQAPASTPNTTGRKPVWSEPGYPEAPPAAAPPPADEERRPGEDDE
jgi:hypothetical protein